MGYSWLTQEGDEGRPFDYAQGVILMIKDITLQA
jgi:hypothetical protein